MTFKRHSGFRDQRGIIGVLGILIYASAIIIVGATMTTTSLVSFNHSNQRIRSDQSLSDAESGAEDALLQIKRNASYGQTTTSMSTSFDSLNRADATVETVNTDCGAARQVTASGYYNNRLVRRVRLTNCPTPSINADFVYALQAGAGGIEMDNNATINGTTYSNGNHVGSNGARVTGDVWVAGAAAATASPSYDPSNPTEFQFGRSTNPNVIDVAQSFVADTSASNKLIKVSLKVKKFGNPANATIRIVTDNGGQPGNTQVASGTLNAASVGNTLQFIDVSMSTPPTLTNGQKYWIVIDTSSSSSNYWAWAASPDSGLGNGNGESSPQWKSGGSMTWNATNTDFAFKAFMGAPATYAQGLTIGGNAHANTLNNDRIAGDAFYQVNNGSTIGGTSNPGSADPPQRDLPITDANLVDFENQAAVGPTYTGNYDVPLGTTATIGPAKIEGNLTVENGATLILNGTVWVTGTMTFSNNATIKLTPGYGSGSGAMVGNGQITIQNNVTFLGSGTTNSFLMLATSATGLAMNVSNNANNIILAAPDGTIDVQNNAGANALVAYKLELSNNATVTYVSGLADINFSAGPGGSFQVHGWQEVVLDQ